MHQILDMPRKRNKKIGLIDTCKEFLDRYWKVITAFAATASVSFWLGVYYETVQKNREITEIKIQHSKEILDEITKRQAQKEQNLRDYFELKEKYLANPKEEKNGKKDIQ